MTVQEQFYSSQNNTPVDSASSRAVRSLCDTEQSHCCDNTTQDHKALFSCGHKFAFSSPTCCCQAELCSLLSMLVVLCVSAWLGAVPLSKRIGFSTVEALYHSRKRQVKARTCRLQQSCFPNRRIVRLSVIILGDQMKLVKMFRSAQHRKRIIDSTYRSFWFEISLMDKQLSEKNGQCV